MIAIGLALLAGCADHLPDEVPKSDIAIWAAAVDCDRTAECARAQFDTAYYSLEDCRASAEIAWGVIAEQFEDCDYDEGRAANRLEEVQEMSCEEWFEGEAAEAYGEIWEGCSFGY